MFLNGKPEKLIKQLYNCRYDLAYFVGFQVQAKWLALVGHVWIEPWEKNASPVTCLEVDCTLFGCRPGGLPAPGIFGRTPGVEKRSSGSCCFFAWISTTLMTDLIALAI